MSTEAVNLNGQRPEGRTGIQPVSDAHAGSRELSFTLARWLRGRHQTTAAKTGWKRCPTLQAAALVLALYPLGLSLAFAAEEAKPATTTNVVASIFPDKALEKAVRRQVFAKRENNEPITAADVADVAIIEGRGLGITNLAGLDQCKKVALINFAENQIADLAPLAGLPRLQSLDLSRNKIGKIDPLASVTALQYLDVSSNRIKKLAPAAGLTNLATLLISENEIADLTPVFGLPKLHSLHFDGNRVSQLKGIASMKRLDLLAGNGNRISDLAPLAGLTDLRFLSLENNRLRDVQPLVAMAEADVAGERRFAPFLRLYLQGNKLQSKKAAAQLDRLRELGVRVNLGEAATN